MSVSVWDSLGIQHLPTNSFSETFRLFWGVNYLLWVSVRWLCRKGTATSAVQKVVQG